MRQAFKKLTIIYEIKFIILIVALGIYQYEKLHTQLRLQVCQR